VEKSTIRAMEECCHEFQKSAAINKNDLVLNTKSIKFCSIGNLQEDPIEREKE
jgi:hypothetical protein